MDRRKDRRGFGAKYGIVTIEHLAVYERKDRDVTPLALEDRPAAAPSRGYDLRNSLPRVPGDSVSPFEFRARSPGRARMQNEPGRVRLDEQDKGLITALQPRGWPNIDAEESLGSARYFEFGDHTHSQGSWDISFEPKPTRLWADTGGLG